MHKSAGTLEKSAVSALVKSYKEGFANAIIKNFAGKSLATTGGSTVFLNSIMAWAEKATLPRGVEQSPYDPMGNATGLPTVPESAPTGR